MKKSPDPTWALVLAKQPQGMFETVQDAVSCVCNKPPIAFLAALPNAIANDFWG